jgi:hypothetical protein
MGSNWRGWEDYWGAGVAFPVLWLRGSRVVLAEWDCKDATLALGWKGVRMEPRRIIAGG